MKIHNFSKVPLYLKSHLPLLLNQANLFSDYEQPFKTKLND